MISKDQQHIYHRQDAIWVRYIKMSKRLTYKKIDNSQVEKETYPITPRKINQETITCDLAHLRMIPDQTKNHIPPDISIDNRSLIMFKEGVEYNNCLCGSDGSVK